MTSSYMKQRLYHDIAASTTDKTGRSKAYAFGPQPDHYISMTGECHPDYEATFFGKIGGPKVCRRIVSNVAQPIVRTANGVFGVKAGQLYDKRGKPRDESQDIAVANRFLVSDHWRQQLPT